MGYEWDINLEASKKHLVNWMGANQKILWDIYIYTYIWVNFITTSLEIMVNKGTHPHMALIQVSEIS